MKENRSLMIISIISLIILLLGSTFSYFNISASSNDDAVGLTAMKFDTSVEVTALYNEKSLIPMNDSDTTTAYGQNCVDDDGFGACQAYNIEITNNGELMEYQGDIVFTIDDIQNLKYLVLDEEENEYVSASSIVAGNPLTLGDSFELDTGESKNFVLIIWLSNLDEPQEDYDADGSFTAAVTYRAASGSKITGTFSS